MAIAPLPSLDRTSPTFKTDVDTFFASQLPAFSVEAEAARSDVVIKQGQAAASAGAAATSEGNALTYKNAAATSEGNALTYKNAALAAQGAAEAALDSFDDRYLGAKSAAPTLDNDGAALLNGALYWDTVLNGGCLRVWQAGAWVTIPANVASAITNTPSGNIAATNVQAALNELDTKKATTAYALAAAAARYGKDNILGTVSQTAGAPTGAIFESGSNANGSFVKFANGTLICNFRRTDSASIGAAFQGGFISGSFSWTFPAAFVAASTPFCSATPYALAASGAQAATTSTNTALLYVFQSNASQAGGDRYVELRAEGKWF